MSDNTKKFNSSLLLLTVVILLLLLIYFLAPEAFVPITNVLSNIPDVHIIKFDQSITDGLVSLIPSVDSESFDIADAVLNIDGDYLIVCAILLIVCIILTFTKIRLTVIPIIVMGALPFLGAIRVLEETFNSFVAAGANNWQAASHIFVPMFIINLACIVCAAIPAILESCRNGVIDILLWTGFMVVCGILGVIFSIIPTTITFLLLVTFKATWAIWAEYICTFVIWVLSGITFSRIEPVQQS